MAFEGQTTAMFNTVLGREPTAEELDTWSTTVEARGLEGAVDRLIDTDEFVIKHTAEVVNPILAEFQGISSGYMKAGILQSEVFGTPITNVNKGSLGSMLTFADAEKTEQLVYDYTLGFNTTNKYVDQILTSPTPTITQDKLDTIISTGMTEGITEEIANNILQEKPIMEAQIPKPEIPTTIIGDLITTPASPTTPIFETTTTPVPADIQAPVTRVEGLQTNINQAFAGSTAALSSLSASLGASIAALREDIEQRDRVSTQLIQGKPLETRGITLAESDLERRRGTVRQAFLGTKRLQTNRTGLNI